MLDNRVIPHTALFTSFYGTQSVLALSHQNWGKTARARPLASPWRRASRRSKPRVGLLTHRFWKVSIRLKMEPGTNNLDISGVVFTVFFFVVMHLISGRLSRTALLRPPMCPLLDEPPLYER